MRSQKLVCFLGPQGSGKGTQSEKLSELLSLPTVSTGSLYRKHVNEESSIGLEVKDYLDRGVWVPDTVTINVIRETLDEPMYATGIILDGFPRSMPQKEFLDQMFETYHVIYIDITDEEVIKRISGRMQCEEGHIYHEEYRPSHEDGICDIDQLPLFKRTDDTPEFLASRLKEYHEKAEPLIEAYKKDRRLSLIDGAQEIDAVFSDIKKVFE